MELRKKQMHFLIIISTHVFVFQDYLTPKMAAKFFEEALRWTKDKGILVWII